MPVGSVHESIIRSNDYNSERWRNGDSRPVGWCERWKKYRKWKWRRVSGFGKSEVYRSRSGKCDRIEWCYRRRTSLAILEFWKVGPHSSRKSVLLHSFYADASPPVHLSDRSNSGRSPKSLYTFIANFKSISSITLKSCSRSLYMQILCESFSTKCKFDAASENAHRRTTLQGIIFNL